MPAYLIVEVKVTDPERYEAYKPIAAAVTAKYGGKYLARGSDIIALEGDWHPARIVVVQFESMQKARAFYESADYAPALAIRKASTISRMILVDGLPAPGS
jgi:uncharacterized protein (DUF1330 family)